ncbi:MAG: ATP-grasp domain-containing protein [Pseudomonadaceae bacterium]
MNVLLTSVGQRSYLVDYFRAALKGSGRVVAVNTTPDTPGMYAADIALVSPPASSDEYIPFILELCRLNHVGLLCALHDLDVFHLSQQRELLDAAGITNTLPDAYWGRLCLDKYASTQVLSAAGLATPWTGCSLAEALNALDEGIIRFPLIVKARFGFGSLGLHLCHSNEQLQQACRDVGSQVAASLGHWGRLPGIEAGEIVIQPALEGREICTGVINDLNGNYQGHVSCHVRSMRHGESHQAVSLPAECTETFARTLSSLSQHRGIWGVDCIESAGKLHAIDINPRFSGDYPFHHLSGADVPSALVAWARGQSAPPDSLTNTPDIHIFKDLTPRLVAGRNSAAQLPDSKQE